MSCIVLSTLQQINAADLLAELIGSLFWDVAVGILCVFPIIEIVELISSLYLASRLTSATSLLGRTGRGPWQGENNLCICWCIPAVHPGFWGSVRQAGGACISISSSTK